MKCFSFSRILLATGLQLLLSGIDAKPVQSVNVADAVIARAEPYCPPITPPPEGSICGKQGQWRQLGLARYKATPAECRDICLKNGACLSYMLYSESGRSENCFLNEYTAAHLLNFHFSNKTGKIFYDRSCYDCSAHCPQDPSVNLLANPGFESSTSNDYSPWTVGDGNGAEVISPGFQSSKALRISLTSISRDYKLRKLITPFNSCPDTTYLLRFDYRITGGNGKRPNLDSTEVVMRIVAGDTQLGQITTGSTYQQVYKNHTWMVFEGYFRPQYANPDLQIQLLVADAKTPSTYTLDIDNVGVYPVDESSLSTKPNAQEILTNGDWETGEYAPFTKEEGESEPVIKSPGLSGNYAAYLGVKSGMKREGLQVTKGKHYLFSFDYTSTGRRVQNLAFGFYDVDRDLYGEGTLQRFVLPIVAYYDTIQFDFAMFDNTMVLDNLSLKELAPPAS